jgi:hypothetical protein
MECKNATKDEAIALGVDQIRRYHRETPELFVSQQLFTATDAIGFSYGVTWNTVRRNIFSWKLEPPRISRMDTDQKSAGNHPCQSVSSMVDSPGRLEAKVRTFCSILNILSFLKDYIVFAERDEELNKYILRRHQTGAVEATVNRALDSQHVATGFAGCRDEETEMLAQLGGASRDIHHRRAMCANPIAHPAGNLGTHHFGAPGCSVDVAMAAGLVALAPHVNLERLQLTTAEGLAMLGQFVSKRFMTEPAPAAGAKKIKKAP